MMVLVTLIGAVVGALGGMFGKGGSAVATPLLHLAGVPALVAVASPLPAAIPSTAVAARAYLREGMVDRRVFRWTVMFGVPATVVGAWGTQWIGGGPLIVATDVLVAGLGLSVLLRPARPPSGPVPAHRGAVLAAVAIGVGLVSGLLGNTGGFLLAPLFTTVLGIDIKRALGTSLAASCVLAVPGAIVHGLLGHLDWGVVVAFGAASIPLSALGARVALRTHDQTLARGYGAVLTAMGLALLATA